MTSLTNKSASALISKASTATTNPSPPPIQFRGSGTLRKQPPFTGPAPYLPRITLVSRLTQASKHGDVTSIVAPAGSGKSTLLKGMTEELKLCGYNTYWISLDASDNDPHNFLKALWFALRDVDPDLSDTELALLKANKESELSARFDALLDILSVRGRKIALCMDDFHHISNAMILRFMNLLLSHISSSVSLIISSRAALPLDTGRRRVAGTLLEVTQQDLNLTPEEVGEYFAKLHGLEISSQDIEILHRITEGWATGIQLAALAIRNAPHQAPQIIRGYSSADRNLKEYLFQTVLRGLPNDIREFLLLTAPLKRLSAPLCNAVTQASNSQDMLEQIETLNLFLIRLDQNNVWFRYHHLFAEFLQNELTRRDPEMVKNVFCRAAQWNQAQGFLTDAIQNLLEAGQFDQAASLINESATHVALDFGDHSKILDWMRRLPTELHDNNPTLLLNHAWSRAFSRDVSTAQELCDRAVELLDAPDTELSEDERNGLRWLSGVTNAIAMGAAENTQSAIPACDDMIERLPRSEPVLIASTCNARAYCHLVHHNLSAAISSAAEAYQLGMRGGSTYSALWGVLLGGLANIEQANLTSADESAAKGLEIFGESDSRGPYLRALAALLPIELATQRGQFSQTQHLLTHHQVMSSIYGPCMLLILQYRNDARQAAWSGSLGLARRVLQQGQDIGLSTDQPSLYYHLVVEEIALQLQFESLAAAKNTAKRTNFLQLSLDSVNSEIRPIVNELQQITEARLTLAQGQYQDALSILHRLMRVADNAGRKFCGVHLRAMRAVAMWRLGKTQDALRELDRAISVCYEQNLVYPIISVGSALIEVLDEIIERREAIAQLDQSQVRKRNFARLVRGLILGESCDPALGVAASSDNQHPHEAIPELTNREIEILKLIAAGLNNQQLADELLITLSTTKWHIHNMFRKLGVKNRVAAITLARRAQII